MEKEYDENMQRKRDREEEIKTDICNKERYILIIYIYDIRKRKVETSIEA